MLCTQIALVLPSKNRLVESMNKALQNIIWKIVNENQIDWDHKFNSTILDGIRSGCYDVCGIRSSKHMGPVDL